MNEPERCPATTTDNHGTRYRCRRINDHALSPKLSFDTNGIAAPTPLNGMQYHVSDPLEHDDGRTCTMLKWIATPESMADVEKDVCTECGQGADVGLGCSTNGATWRHMVCPGRR